VSWVHVLEGAIGAGGALVAFTIARKVASAVAYRAISAALARRRRLR
jgi:hypothetical protein